MANKILTNPEAALKFADNAQSPTKDLTLTALAAGAGRISARHDRGVGARAMLFEWRATFQMATAGVIGETIGIWISSSDGTNPDGEEGIVDAVLSAGAKTRNMIQAGVVVVDTVNTDTDITASGQVAIPGRYFSVVVFNDTVDDLRTSTAVHSVTLTPIPDEIQ